MSNKRKIKLPVNKLLVGFMVDLELPWTKHPFIFSKFKISSQSDIQAIIQLGLKDVTVFPDQSDIEIAHKSQSETVIAEETPSQIVKDKWKKKNEQIDQADAYRNKRINVAKKYKAHAAKVKKLTHELKTSPANAIRDAAKLVDEMASEFESHTNLFTNLVNLGSGQHTMYNHCMNVTILSLNLAVARGIRGEKLRWLARGALLHDVGKVELPGVVLNKKAPLNKAEKGVYQQHPKLGRKLCELVEGMPQDVLNIIELHHEFVDGTGFPNQLAGEKIPEVVRIVSIANIYDNLCNSADTTKSLPPKIALATMYSKLKDKLDIELIQTFISTLGVFPPGSVVSLNDESIGLVVSVDPKDMLNPEVLLYNPEIPRSKALIINLKEHPEIKIEKVLKAGEYPKRVFEYLGIEERVGLMISEN